MGWRGTLILALLIVAVGGLLWLEGAPPAGRDPSAFGDAPALEPTKPLPALLSFKPAEVVGVRLERHAQVREAERRNGTWTNTDAADAIDDFLTDLAGLGILMDIPAGGADLQDYGLEPPQGILELRLSGRDTPLVLQIGDRNPATTGVYVRIGKSGKVALAGALVAWDFDKAFAALGGGASEQ